MKLLTTICMPALMLGAATLVMPALAQTDAAASGNAAAAAPAQPAQDANSAAAPAQAAVTQDSSASASSQTAMSQSTSAGNSQMAMNTTGNASDLSSVPDNQHKYSKAKKASQNKSEDETTRALNQKESSLSGASSTSSAQ